MYITRPEQRQRTEKAAEQEQEQYKKERKMEITEKGRKTTDLIWQGSCSTASSHTMYIYIQKIAGIQPFQSICLLFLSSPYLSILSCCLLFFSHISLYYPSTS